MTSNSDNSNNSNDVHNTDDELRYEYWLLDEDDDDDDEAQQPSAVAAVAVAAIAPQQPQERQRLSPPTCICYGTGRFLRSVLIPILNEAFGGGGSGSGGTSSNNNNNSNSITDDAMVCCCIQPRGTSFISYMKQQQQQKLNVNEKTKSSYTYDVDVVLHNGTVQTEHIACRGVFSMKSIDSKLWPLFFPPSASTTTVSSSSSSSSPIQVIGVGVTEAGLASHRTSAMQDVYTLLQYISQQPPYNNNHNHNTNTDGCKICVINTDNVPNNGTIIEQHMRTIATTTTTTAGGDDHVSKQQQQHEEQERMLSFLTNSVVFCNTMVDRIVSSRDSDTDGTDIEQQPKKWNAMVPRTEPTPQKALVLLDPNHELPKELYTLHDREVMRRNSSSSNSSRRPDDMSRPGSTTGTGTKKYYGLVIRNTVEQFQADLQYKLTIANATHTALAHTMALLSYPQTNVLSVSSWSQSTTDDTTTTTPTDTTTMHAKLLMKYVHSMVHQQIIPAILKRQDRPDIDVDEQQQHQKQQQVVYAAAMSVWEDWSTRLCHGSFGLSTFFITQNGAAKSGIRLTPTIVSLLSSPTSSTTGLTTTTTGPSSIGSTILQPTGISVTMVYAYASILRWLTPIRSTNTTTTMRYDDNDNTVYVGWLDGFVRHDVPVPTTTTTTDSSGGTDNGHTVMYADNLRYNLHEGWYEFKCACYVNVEVQGSSPLTATTTTTTSSTSTNQKSVASWLGSYHTSQQPSVYIPIIRAYMMSVSGGNFGATSSTTALETFVSAIATIYARMIVGDGLINILSELLVLEDNRPDQNNNNDTTTTTTSEITDASQLVDIDPKLRPMVSIGMPLHFRPNHPIPDHSGLLNLPILGTTTIGGNVPITGTTFVDDIVINEVASTLVIDIHTHLLPPTHGSLCLWGIDELLSYHYLVAEYFVTAPTSITPELFYIKPKHEQADLIWKALFIDRMPLSEATRGVVTTLTALGLSKYINARDLSSIRKFYDCYRDDGVRGVERFSNLIHNVSGVRYNIMTNIPFDMNEAQYWRPKQQAYSSNYRSALRVDPLLTGDKEAITQILRSSGYDATIEGACQYLRDWCDVMKPEYMMASTPHNFVIDEGKKSKSRNSFKGINMGAMKVPGAFVDVVASIECTGADTELPSLVDENSDFLSDVLMRVCEERDLPIALKIGAHRGINDRLKQAGDGVVAFADMSMLSRLCTRFPRVRFLATFLSRNNQHEACVLASKFSNLHLYGCWWYCFTPSIVNEITQMRIEMLGTAFTAQHSDARVLDQLIYKWAHSRNVIASVVTVEMKKLLLSGWNPNRGELRSEVRKLFGESYEQFMNKSFI